MARDFERRWSRLSQRYDTGTDESTALSYGANLLLLLFRFTNYSPLHWFASIVVIVKHKFLLIYSGLLLHKY